MLSPFTAPNSAVGNVNPQPIKLFGRYRASMEFSRLTHGTGNATNPLMRRLPRQEAPPGQQTERGSLVLGQRSGIVARDRRRAIAPLIPGGNDVTRAGRCLPAGAHLETTTGFIGDVTAYTGRIASREPLAVLPKSAYPEKPKKPRNTWALTEWRPMTENEQALANALVCCTFLPGSAHKRFARALAAQAERDEPKITDPQRAQLHRLVHRYRRQIDLTTARLA